MKKILVIIIGFTAVIISCNSELDTSPKNKFSSGLIIIGQDMSKTFKEYPRISPSLLKKSIEELGSNNKEIAVYFLPIGNKRYGQPLQLKLKKSEVTLGKGTLSEQKQKMESIKQIQKENRMALQTFVGYYQDTIYSSPPEEDTDLKGFFDKVAQIINEPRYVDFEKVVYLYSDGKHSMPDKEGMSSLNMKRFSDTYFFTTGIENPKLKKQLNAKELNTPEAFFQNLNYQLKNLESWNLNTIMEN